MYTKSIQKRLIKEASLRTGVKKSFRNESSIKSMLIKEACDRLHKYSSRKVAFSLFTSQGEFRNWDETMKYIKTNKL
jgi:hypothetical protein